MKCLCWSLCGDILESNSHVLVSQVSRIADSEQSVMLMLGRCLPHIVPNVLLAKREVTNDLLTQQPHQFPSANYGFHVHCGWLLPLIQFLIQCWLNLYVSIAVVCVYVCVSLSMPPPTQSTSLLFCSVHSFLLLLLCMHLTAPIENGCAPLSGEWKHIGTFSHQPSFLHHACDIWPFSWLGFSSAYFVVSDS